jgi:hypothetical protein
MGGRQAAKEIHYGQDFPRKNAESPGTAKDHLQRGSQEIKAIAGIVRSPRSFIFKTPDDYGLKG